MLYIRADGNAEIGTGHIMRCLSIAGAVRGQGQECTFLTADPQMAPLLREKGYAMICLDSAWNDMERELDKMERLIAQKRMRRLFVDSYYATPAYLDALDSLTRLVYIDDLNRFHYPCSALINYNIYARPEDYGERYAGTRLLLGPKYAPLREEFWHLPHCPARDKARSVLVTTGGTDPENIAGRLVERAKKMPGPAQLDYHIVVGRFNDNEDMLERLAGRYPGVVLHRNVKTMAKLMQDCDLAISAAGSTLYELCACGIPAVIFAYADNQLAGASAFGRELMCSVGDVRVDTDHKISWMLADIERLCDNANTRRALSEKLRALVDGNGAKRLARAIVNL